MEGVTSICSNHENKTHELKTIGEPRKFSATKFTRYRVVVWLNHILIVCVLKLISNQIIFLLSGFTNSTLVANRCIPEDEAKKILFITRMVSRTEVLSVKKLKARL